MDSQLQQLIQDEFEEIPCENITILQIGKKFSKIKGFKTACSNFEKTLDQNTLLFRVNDNIDFFAKKLGIEAVSQNILFQGDKQIEYSKEQILGSYAVVKKRINKNVKSNYKKKNVLHLQNEIDQIEVNPKTYTQESQQAKEQIEQDVNPFGELYKQQYPEKKEKIQKLIRTRLTKGKHE